MLKWEINLVEGLKTRPIHEYSLEAESLSQNFIARLVSLCNLGLSSQTILGLRDFRRLQNKKTEPSSPVSKGLD